MKDESKSDVFSHVAQELIVYQSDSSYENGGEYNESKELDKLCTRYKNALPDDIPMIPQAAGDSIKIHKECKHSLLDIFGALSIYDVSRTEPAQDYNAWILHHPNTFTLAWVLGVWRVEETGKVVKL